MENGTESQSDSDTDAIIENSPLDQYLRASMRDEGDSVVSEFVATHGPKEEEEDKGGSPDHPACFPSEPLPQREEPTKIDQLVFSALRLSQDPREIARSEALPKMLISVSHFGIVESEDSELLHKAAQLYAPSTSIQFLFGYPYMLRLFFLISVSSLSSIWLFFNKETASSNLPTLLLWMILLLIHLRHYLLYQKSMRNWRKMRHEVFDAMEKATALWKELKKSLREVREREILGRGYTLASGHVPLAGNPMEIRKTRMYCEGLRKECFGSMKKFIRALRRQAEVLDQWDDVYNEEERISSLSFADFASLCPLFTKDEVESDEWLSVEALKALLEFSRMFTSDLVRCFLVGVARSDRGPVRNSGWYNVAQVAEKASLRVKTASSTYCEISQSSSNDGVTTKDEGSGPGLTVGSALRNLELHLEEALLKTRETSSAALDEEVLEGIKCSVASVKICLEDLEGLIAPPQPLPSKLPPPIISQSGPQRLISEDFQPRIVDQVFEAASSDIVSAQEAATDEDGSSQGSYSDRESEKREATRLLAELKSVLGIRSDSMRMRELKALAEYRNVTLEEVLQEEEEEAAATLKAAKEDTVSQGETAASSSADPVSAITHSGTNPDSFVPAPVTMSDLASLISNRCAAMRQGAQEEMFLGDGEISESESDLD